MLDPASYERVEAAEDTLNRLIERRAQQAKREEAEEAFWRVSERKHYEQQQEALRQEWIEHHLRQAAALEETAHELAEEHREAARRLRENGKKA